VAAARVGEEFVEDVAAAITVPEVVVGVTDGTLRIEDLLLDLVEPCLLAGHMHLAFEGNDSARLTASRDRHACA
jgi:hypothetical protein